jgi:hypothetical protein
MSHSLSEDAEQAPSPALFFQIASAYQSSAALKAAVELDLFTAIGGGATAAEAARKCAASERGIRILSDYLTIIGFLNKDGDRYALTPDSAMFLDKNSRAYQGGVLGFLHSSTVLGAFEHLTEAVRTGGTALPSQGSVEDHHPVWADFARAMMPMMMMPAQAVAQLVGQDPSRRVRVLDIAAGHGLYGIVLA